MSEDKGQPEKISTELSASDTPANKTTTLSQVEERLSQANSPQEALFWIQIRGELIKQNEIIQEGDRRRFVQQIQLWRRIGVSVAALTIGLVFFSIGSTEAGLLVIGVFLYELAPDLNKETFEAEAKEKMISTTHVGFRSIVVGLILASATACLLFVVGTETTSGIDQVLIIISGMTTIAALSAFERFIESKPRSISSGDDITFNEFLVSKSILEIEVSELNCQHPEQISVTQASPWDLSLNQLVGTDNSLALAKLKIEIERELRRIAYERSIDISTRPIDIIGIAEELVSTKAMPDTFLTAIGIISRASDRAIHGAEISDKLNLAMFKYYLLVSIQP